MKTKMLWSLPLFMGLCLACGKKSTGNSNPTGGGDNTNNPPPVVTPKSDVELWLTQSDKSVLFKKQNTSLVFSTTSNSYSNIDVDDTQTYQQIDGFGYCLTGGSASLLNSMTAANRDNILKELFAADSTFIGVSYLRISIGASDLSANTFTYDDMPSGQTDESLDHFSIDAEKTDLIPILKKILAINPNIKILGSPWSPPVWMKSNNSFKAGSLKPEYYAAYAQYFVKYIQAMKAEGINIDAVTVQNEPLNGNNNPSLVMQATEQANFVKTNLGPAFQAAGLGTKIIVWDHNADVASYPLAILGDADAKKYVDGSAFHLYSGSITALSQVHDAYPDKNVYFTEQWVGGPGNFSGDLQWHVQNLIIGATRNWSRNVLEWNLASDPGYNPHTNGGCSTCQGALTISGDAVNRNVSYYIIAHAAKFVRPGSVRISSAQTANLLTVAFKNPDGKKVLIVLNKGAAREMFNIKVGSRIVTTALSSGAVGTFVW